MQLPKKGTLYLIATPLGNLADISLRALELLKHVDQIAAEDTRHSRKLLDHYGIHSSLISLHNYNEHQRVNLLIQQLNDGKNIALISDAGTPLISDPGYPLVKAAHENGIIVISVPGACAAIVALSVSGLPTDRFIFEGFLPPKGEARKKRLLALASESRTIIFYESVHRIMNLLELLLEVMGGKRLICVARELTKQFETCYRGSITEVVEHLKNHSSEQKGEFVVVLAGANASTLSPNENEQCRVLEVLLAELPLKQAVSLAVSLTGVGRKKLYEQALNLQRRHLPHHESESENGSH